LRLAAEAAQKGGELGAILLGYGSEFEAQASTGQYMPHDCVRANLPFAYEEIDLKR